MIEFAKNMLDEEWFLIRMRFDQLKYFIFRYLNWIIVVWKNFIKYFINIFGVYIDTDIFYLRIFFVIYGNRYWYYKSILAIYLEQI